MRSTRLTVVRIVWRAFDAWVRCSLVVLPLSLVAFLPVLFQLAENSNWGAVFVGPDGRELDVNHNLFFLALMGGQTAALAVLLANWIAFPVYARLRGERRTLSESASHFGGHVIRGVAAWFLTMFVIALPSALNYWIENPWPVLLASAAVLPFVFVVGPVASLEWGIVRAIARSVSLTAGRRRVLFGLAAAMGAVWMAAMWLALRFGYPDHVERIYMTAAILAIFLGSIGAVAMVVAYHELREEKEGSIEIAQQF